MKTPSSPVIRNVLTIASLEHTITSEPSSRRRRRCAPISTPSDDESMNVVSVRSTIDVRAARVDRGGHALLELRGGEEIDLAGDRDDVGLVVDGAVLN